ncbi:MFS transporter [Actinosynnema sp. NPDC091369]
MKFLDQPRQVWVTAFAAVIAFMGIGLVDPILLSIAEGLHATPSQVTLLFSSYLGVQVVAMLFTGVASARFGPKRTLVGGLALIVVATALCALAGDIGQLVGLRAVWGLGNAFFIATALSVIVGAATGGQKGAILLYEAALGLGLSVGPLLGALLGSFSWRGPFIGTAVLMAVAFVLCSVFLANDEPQHSIRLLDPLRALRHPGLLRTAIGSALYTAAFFAVLAWSPFVLGWGAVRIGLVFFGWGACVAVSSVWLAPRLADRFGDRRTTVVAVIVSGVVSGLLNTLFTSAAMSVSPAPRPVASAGYNFLRWLGGALAATFVGHLAQPFVVAAGCCVLAACLPAVGRTSRHVVPTEAILVGEDLVG